MFLIVSYELIYLLINIIDRLAKTYFKLRNLIISYLKRLRLSYIHFPHRYLFGGDRLHVILQTCNVVNACVKRLYPLTQLVVLFDAVGGDDQRQGGDNDSAAGDATGSQRKPERLCFQCIVGWPGRAAKNLRPCAAVAFNFEIVARRPRHEGRPGSREDFLDNLIVDHQIWRHTDLRADKNTNDGSAALCKEAPSDYDSLGQCVPLVQFGCRFVKILFRSA